MHLRVDGNCSYLSKRGQAHFPKTSVNLSYNDYNTHWRNSKFFELKNHGVIHKDLAKPPSSSTRIQSFTISSSFIFSML